MNILNEILEVKKGEVASLRKMYSRSSFNNFEMFGQKSIGFKNALSKSGKLNLIAEIKKASPSKGILKEEFDHLKIAEMYFSNGVDAVSVLTDEKFFMGNISYLNDIAEIKNVPLLRKDFIIDEFQIMEAKAHGADAVLLIAEALSALQVRELTHAAFENDLEVLLEIHSPQQIEKADFALNKIIGINNRDLETFNVDLNTTIEIIKMLPDDFIVVSESGINKETDIEQLKNTRLNAVLVGEYFMTSISVDAAVKQFLKWCEK